MISRGEVVAAAAGGSGTAASAVEPRRRDSLAQRWAMLAPHVRVHGPADDGRRPALVMFHGCGGMRDQVGAYATAAAVLGVRSFAVDSYAPRGWSRGYARSVVCTGLRFQGAERAGDVLAAVHGVAGRADVDPERLLLLGWSHGAWSIMDLMTMSLTRPGEAGLADPAPEALEGVRGLFLLYPWAGPAALSRKRPWVRSPEVYGVAAPRDHLATIGMARAIYGSARRAGAAVDLWEPPGATHGFDEPGQNNAVMRYNPLLGRESVERFSAFAARVLALEAGEERVLRA